MSGLHNLPPAIQERAMALPEYNGKQKETLSTPKRIWKKSPALLVALILFSVMIMLTGAITFQTGFLFAFVLWTIIKLYVTAVLNCGWYAHTPSAWIPGTEDMKKEYQNYKFYLSSIPRSLVAGAIVSAVVGIVVMAVPS